MKHTNTILDKVANEHNYLESDWWDGFLKAIYDLYYTTEGVLGGNDCAKSLVHLFAEKNDIPWEFAVKHLYCYIREVVGDFYERYSKKIDWVKLCSDEKHTVGKFIKIKGNEKYASRELFEQFCKRDQIDIEDYVCESLLDSYGWTHVVWIIVFNVIEEYLSVEERYENIEDDSQENEPEIANMGHLDTKTEVFEIVTSIEEEYSESSEEATEVTVKEIETSETIPSTEDGKVYGKKAVKAICLDDGIETIYKSISEVAKALGIKPCTVSNFKSGKKEYCRSKTTKKKYKFEFFDEDKGKILMVEPSTKKILETYNKATDVSRVWGINYDTLQGKLKNKNPEFHQLDGYEWWRECDYKKQYAAA